MTSSGVKVHTSPILRLPIVTYRVFPDDRGDFAIPFQQPAMTDAGLLLSPIRQVNVSLSRQADTTRGLHVSNTGKFVSAPLAAADEGFFSVVVKLDDPGHPDYGTVETFELSQGTALYIPPGYGNGLQNRVANAVYHYLLDGVFDPAAERVVSLLDPELSITWPRPPQHLSAKDQTGLSLADYTIERRQFLVHSER